MHIPALILRLYSPPRSPRVLLVSPHPQTCVYLCAPLYLPLPPRFLTLARICMESALETTPVFLLLHCVILEVTSWWKDVCVVCRFQEVRGPSLEGAARMTPESPQPRLRLKDSAADSILQDTATTGMSVIFVG